MHLHSEIYDFFFKKLFHHRELSKRTVNINVCFLERMLFVFGIFSCLLSHSSCLLDLVFLIPTSAAEGIRNT